MLGVLGKYISGKKCHFYMPPKAENNRHEIVVLVHGLIRRSTNMRSMGKFLCRHGYTVYIYDYKTSTKGISAHGNDLRKYLHKVLKENPTASINIVTHSMGGILTRYALAKNTENDNKTPSLDISRIKRIVMLAPPHGGSNTARLLTKYFPVTGKWLKPLPELSNATDSLIHSTPQIPDGPEIGIIAGKYDTEVATKDTHLEGMKEHFILKSEHSFMVYLPSTHKATLRFLATGEFR
jgi:alpha-beta hydrolase superfamily lysophospholipase